MIKKRENTMHHSVIGIINGLSISSMGLIGKSEYFSIKSISLTYSIYTPIRINRASTIRNKSAA